MIAAALRKLRQPVTSWIQQPPMRNHTRPVSTRSTPFATALAIALSLLCVAAPSWAQGNAASASAAPTDPAAAKAAKEPGAIVTESGLVYRSLKDGKGGHPQATDKVKVHYRGTFPDCKEFDSSHSRGKPAEFPLNRVIKCWTEGVQRMQVGGKARLTCPPAIAYGERGAGGTIPPNATLHFEVELLGIEGR